MPRERSRRVAEIKARLVSRVQDGIHRPGDRFLSTRAVARLFGVSYQTAHRLLTELQDEGRLARRAASGTYLAGSRTAAREVQLLFAARARTDGTFGARLHATLTTRLTNGDLGWTTSWQGAAARRPHDPHALRLARRALPVMWDAPDALSACLAARRSAVLLNERPPSGLESVFIDSVSIDDFAGGVYAGQLLARHRGRGGFAILAGPTHDPRSQARVAGCLSRLRATVVHAPSWYLEGGLTVAASAVAAGRRGVFCANDRLAEAIVAWCRTRETTPPPLVGFDDAPVAEALGLTTIAMPWNELAEVATAVIRRRLADDSASATHVVLSPRPVVRG